MVCVYPHPHPEECAIAFPQALIEAARGWRSRTDALLREHGLTCAMGAVMTCLASNTSSLSQRELAQAVGVEGPTLVRLLDRLEEGGFARRICDPANRRVKRVELTDKAKPCFEALRRIDEQLKQDLLRDIPKTDIEVAQKVLLAICERL